MVIGSSGPRKALIFSLHAIILAIEEQKTMPIVGTEGPFCLIIAPSV